jgi:hypothetical protein
MGTILGTKITSDDKVIFEVEMDYKDSLKLKGHVKNVHVFSEDAAEFRTNVSQRGTNDTTKYFLIPRKLREGLNFDKVVKCQKIETDNRKIFVFVMDKVCK